MSEPAVTGGQRFRNLEHSRKVAITTGANPWAAGLDVAATPPTTVRARDRGHVFRVEPAKALAFANEPHAQTSCRSG